MIGIWNHKDSACAKEIIKLQRSAYGEEAAWIGRKDLPPLFETEKDIEKSGDIHLAEMEAGELLGMLVFAMEPQVLHMHKLMVFPCHSRKRVASHLLEFVEYTWKPEVIFVSTASGNDPAIEFYRKHGFRIQNQEKKEDGFVLTHLMKRVSRGVGAENICWKEK
ncbi:GNAT family N-acetyltransferase [Salimicrobium sp. PL1-032A]|uniref:GNAT family N-acetyltransferase n=1 Tax=Salimicrobium sp. PL1-032A TaxID=3095364 RepID=UPI0032605117